MNTTLSQAIKHWSYIAPLVQYPKTRKACDALSEQLNELLTIVGENENHPLMGLIDILSTLIEEYEAEHFPIPAKKGINALKYLMASQGLKQSDLSDVASQGVLSEILNEKRQLNLRQIQALAKRFKVDPSTFIDD